MAEALAEKSTSLRVLTNSAMSEFKRCRRRYKYAYVDRLRPLTDKKAFAFGSAGHEAVNILETEGLEAAICSCECSDRLDDFERQTLAALIRGFADRYGTSSLETVSREEKFERPIRNPESNAPSRTFVAGGKVDGKVTLEGNRPALLERKFIKESPSLKLWNRLLIDTQVSHYCLHTGIGTVVYDVIRKPAMEPYKATPIDKRKYKADGTLYANQREFDETPSEWGVRLYADICERPDFYYGRREIPRLLSDLEQYESEQWDIAKDIRDAELNDRWYRNSNQFNCDNCQYFDICTGFVPYEGTHAPDGFQFVENANTELME